MWIICMLTKIKRLEYLDFEIVDQSRIEKKIAKKRKISVISQ